MNTYIVAATPSAAGKAKRGNFRTTRPDTLAAEVFKHLLVSVPNVALAHPVITGAPARALPVFLNC